MVNDQTNRDATIDQVSQGYGPNELFPIFSDPKIGAEVVHHKQAGKNSQKIKGLSGHSEEVLEGRQNHAQQNG